MSKAFTRESDGRGEEAPLLRSELPAGVRNYVTPEWASTLTERLRQFIERKKALDTSKGGLSADDSEARKLDTEIRKLKQSLDSLIVAEKPADQEKAAFGAVVVLKRSHDEEESYRIVGVEEADPERSTISWISPLAKALMTRKAGDKIRFRSPAGEQELTILSVRYP